METRTLATNCGVVIANVDLADMTEETCERNGQAFIGHGLVLFCDQNLAPEQHIKLA